MPGLPERGIGQGGLVALMAVAFGALAITRLGGGPAATRRGRARCDAITGRRRVRGAVGRDFPRDQRHGCDPDARPVRRRGDRRPTRQDPGAEPPEADAQADAAPAGSAEPAPTRSRRGDTLSGIAAEHGTTWQVLAQLNKIDDPRRLRVGQVLDLP